MGLWEEVGAVKGWGQALGRRPSGPRQQPDRTILLAARLLPPSVPVDLHRRRGKEVQEGGWKRSWRKGISWMEGSWSGEEDDGQWNPCARSAGVGYFDRLAEYRLPKRIAKCTRCLR